MNNLTEQVKHGAEQALASLSNGWRELRNHTSSALTHFQSSGEKSPAGDGSDSTQLPTVSSWGFMAADVVDSKNRVIVRLEAPGMSRSDFTVELRGEALVIEGEKRIEHKFGSVGHRTIQCAYGSFRRDVPLSVAVNPNKARATYRDSVLRVVLPKT